MFFIYGFIILWWRVFDEFVEINKNLLTALMVTDVLLYLLYVIKKLKKGF
jgi:hypothetical protein